MKYILYIGDFKEFFATENYIAYGLEQLGYTVLRVNESAVRSAKQVLGAAIKYKVEFVLLSKGHFASSDEAIDLLRKHKFITVGWMFDLFFNVPAFFGRRTLTNSTFKSDICCMTDGGHKVEWRNFRVNHRLLRQGIHKPDAHYGTSIAKHPEIVFIGTYSYDERIKLVNFLRNTYGSNFKHYGRGGDVREIRGKALNDVLASAKIVVGDSMPSPNYWSNRIYEIMGRGGFLLHPIVEGIETEFIDGKHFVGYAYGNHQSVKEKIDYYLTHEQEREAIRKAGHEHVKKNFTYIERSKQLIKYVEEFKNKSGILGQQS